MTRGTDIADEDAVARAGAIAVQLLEKLKFKGQSYDELYANEWYDLSPTPTKIEIVQALGLISKNNKITRRGTSFFVKRASEPEIDVGTKLWRIVGFRLGLKFVADHEQFQKTDRGSYLVHACWGVSSNPSVWSARPIAIGGSGFKCFAKDEPPKNWTHFEVTGFANNGRSAFVKAVAGPEADLLAQYPPRPVNAPAPVVPVAPLPQPKKPPYVCGDCSKGEGSTGRGKCVICKQDYT